MCALERCAFFSSFSLFLFYSSLFLSLCLPFYVVFSTFLVASLLFTSFGSVNVCLCEKMSEWVLVSCCSWVSLSFFLILSCFFRFYSICSVHILLLMCYCSLLFHPFFLHLFSFHSKGERRLCSFLFYMVAFVELAAIKANGNGTGVFLPIRKTLASVFLRKTLSPFPSLPLLLGGGRVWALPRSILSYSSFFDCTQYTQQCKNFNDWM